MYARIFHEENKNGISSAHGIENDDKRRRKNETCEGIKAKSEKLINESEISSSPQQSPRFDTIFISIRITIIIKDVYSRITES